MFDRITSETMISGTAGFSGCFSRRERITSTRSFGRMKPPAPVSGDTSVDTARAPLGRIAAMKPEPVLLTSFCSRIGSPAMTGSRAIEPAIWVGASGRSGFLMKLLLAVADGQVCQAMSSGLTVWPRPMSDLATSTSTVGNCATGSAGAGLVSFAPLASQAATPPALSAMPRTMIRAVFIRFYSSAPLLNTGQGDTQRNPAADAASVVSISERTGNKRVKVLAAEGKNHLPDKRL